MKSLLAKHETKAKDLAWETIDAKRDIQQIKILLEEALDHIENTDTELNRDALNGWVSSALLICMGKKAAEWQVEKDKKAKKHNMLDIKTHNKGN